MVRPEVTETKEQGPNRIMTFAETMKNIDPATYYYEKFKTSGNQYFNDKMWTEAAKAGQTDALIGALGTYHPDTIKKAYEQGSVTLDEEGHKLTKEDLSVINNMMSYGDDLDYDTYMYTLSFPYQDDTEQKEQYVDVNGEPVMMTDKQYALQILKNEAMRITNKQIEEAKATQNWFESVGNHLTSLGGRLLLGIAQFAQDIWNLGEGLLNIGVSWFTGEDSGTKFLEAFEKRDEDMAEILRGAVEEHERLYTGFVNAETGEYTTWGKWVTSGIESLGYMIPSMVAGSAISSGILKSTGSVYKMGSYVTKTTGTLGKLAARSAGTAIFYTGVVSGNIQDAVQQATNNGLTLKQLNAGEIVANAAIKGVAQAAVEVALDKILGATTIDRLMGRAGKLSTTTVKAAGATGIKAAGYTALRVGKEALQEGLEEVLQDGSDKLVDYWFTRLGTDMSNVYMSNITEYSIEDLVDSFVVGGLMSIVTTSVRNTSALWDREIKTTETGEAKKMGYFQTLNFREALQTINEWHNTLGDKTSSYEAKQEAARNMSFAMGVLGSVFKDLGEDKAIKANNILTGFINDEARKEEVKILSEGSYANNLYDKFIKSYENARKIYMSTKASKSIEGALTKIKKALGIDKVTEALKKQQVTSIDNVITQETTIDDLQTPMTQGELDIIKSNMSASQISVVAQINRPGIIKSDDIAFIDFDTLRNTKSLFVSEAFDTIVTEVYNEFSTDLKDLLISFYMEVTGVKSNEATPDVIIKALLFDKGFYTKLLLICKEYSQLNEHIDIISTIDKLIYNKGKSKNLIDDVTKAALKKARENMKVNLIIFATQYAQLDLSKISNKVLTIEDKERIKNDRNNIFSEAYNKLCNDIKNKRQLDSRLLNKVSETINKYWQVLFEDEHFLYLTKEEAENIKQKINSKINSNDELKIIDGLLAFNKLYLSMPLFDSKKKVILLPQFNNEIAESDDLKKISEFVGTPSINTSSIINSIIDGTFDFSKASDNLLGLIQGGAFNIANKIERFKLAQRIVENVTNNKFSLDEFGNIWKILTANEFIKDEYLLKKDYFVTKWTNKIVVDKDGKKRFAMDEAQFIKDIRSGKIKYLSDISKLPNLPKIKLKIDDETKLGGYVRNDTTTIYLGIEPLDMLTVLLHEATHIGQNIVIKNMGKNLSINNFGGNIDLWAFTNKELNDLTTYFKTSLPTYYEICTKLGDTDLGNILYTALDGEFKAMSIINPVLSAIGFRHGSKDGKADYNTIITPDNKEFKVTSISDINDSILSIKRQFNQIRQLKLIDNKDIKANSVIIKKIISKLETLKRIFVNHNINTDLSNMLSNLYDYEYSLENTSTVDVSMAISRQNVIDNIDNTLQILDNSFNTLHSFTNRQISAFPTNKVNIEGKEYIVKEADETKTKKTRKLTEGREFVSNKVANQSNLKYFVKKGKPILIDTKLKDFIVSTTNDFDKLNGHIKTKILNGTLTLNDIRDFVATAKSMNDYTFQSIAKYAYRNEELAKLTWKEASKLMEDLNTLSTLYYINVNNNNQEGNNKVLSLDELYDTYKKSLELSKLNKDFAKEWIKADKATTSYKGEDITPDIRQMNALLFNHYDGTINSLRSINTLGKFIAYAQQLGSTNEQITSGEEDTRAGDSKGAGLKSTKAWNYIDSMKQAEIDYNDEVGEVLSDIDKNDKVQSIVDEYVAKLKDKMKNYTREQIASVQQRIIDEVNKLTEKLNNMSEEELDRRYLMIVGQTKNNQAKAEDITETKVPYEQQERTDKNRKDQLRNIASSIAKKLAFEKDSTESTKYLQNKRYESLSDQVKELISRDGKLTDKYKTMTSEQLEEAIAQLKEANSKLADLRTEQKQRKEAREAAKKAREKLEAKQRKEVEKKTLKEKVDVQYKTTIKEQTFDFTSNNKITETATSLLDTTWSKTRESSVKVIGDNEDQNVANAKEFYEQNSVTLMSADIDEIADTIMWFDNVKLNNASTAEFKKFVALKMYFLGFVYNEMQAGGLFENLNANLKQKVEHMLKTEATGFGTGLAVWNNIRKKLNPVDAMKSSAMIIDGVLIDDDIKDDIYDAIKDNNLTKLQNAQRRAMEYVEKHKTEKKPFLRKLHAFRSMMMLSSPITWLRNRVSNIMVKRINKLSTAIGNKLFTGKTREGQLKMNKQVTPEIQEFIVKQFLTPQKNGKTLFDTLVNSIGKYNPSDVSRQYRKENGNVDKKAIMTQMIIKSMYGEYYNEHTFDNKFLNSVHKKLMQVMSDDSYIREAAIRYLGKIIAEKGYDLSTKTEIDDSIMTDFANAVGLAMADYMHADNFFNKFEQTMLENGGQVGWFAYKTLLPFASASWNWFKAAMKLTPFGLARSIVNMARLEKNIDKAVKNWEAGKSTINPQLAEYIARRDLGQGVIGTIAFGVGMLLAGLGFIKIDDSDEKPKLQVGNLKIDITSIFGSSSLLAAASLVTGMQDRGMTWDGFIEGLNRAADVTIDDFPLMQIIELDMYTNGAWNIAHNYLDSLALSYIPNILGWIAGATYSGNVKKNTLWQRAAAKIPFLGNVLEKKINPYTGEDSGWIEAINRVVPYLSYVAASENESKTTALGLNKTMLRGEYTINGESFNVSGSELQKLNETYGKLNATDLTQFYNNQYTVEVKDGKTMRKLTYNQMDDEQRRKAVQTIMSNNAELVKIAAWTSKGNKYYASDTIYTKLRKAGITQNVYKGSKGYVSK